jgi:translation initiation factor IF-2
MSEPNEPDQKKPLTLSGRSKLEVRKPPAVAGQVHQSFSRGRTKTVTVEVKKKRAPGRPQRTGDEPKRAAKEVAEAIVDSGDGGKRAARQRVVLKALTDDEKATRARALEDSKKATVEARARAEVAAEQAAKEEERFASERQAAEAREAEELERKKREEEAKLKAAEKAAQRLGDPDSQPPEDSKESQEARRPRRPGQRVDFRRPTGRRGDRRRSGKLTVSDALNERERVRSLASVRRAREREKRQASGEDQGKIYRDVVIPESITVQELANRMAERGVDVIRSLMKMGVMANINQSVDADTAEIIVQEYGHRAKRVSAADVEIGFKGEEDEDATLAPRAPVVTVMGHVDHGKTSLLDAIRKTDVASGEAGGITQHIGAYQVRMPGGKRITFIDTPGHEAFTAMRARGAQVTDIVVLVVAADDGIMPQTVEAIDHARAAEVPIIVAINKMDRPDADADKIRQQLLQHEVVVESMGGDVLTVEVSAKEGTNLDKLEEAILLQSELLELRANPDRRADGTVVEARLEQGRGSVATVLVRRGTLRIGDVLVAGPEWGRVRAMFDDHGDPVQEAGPGVPVEVLGLDGTPLAGDEFGVVENESKARSIAEFRTDQRRAVRTAATAPGSVEDLFAQIKGGELKELPIVIKGDVRGSLEAIEGALAKVSTDEVAARVLHSAVGGINESDITLAQASDAMIIGFNVRANAAARERAKRDNVSITYYSVIYELVDQVKGLLSGMLPPSIRETLLGEARVKEVFNVSKTGKVAGCEVVDGFVRRGARVRLLRDDIVVHEGTLGTLRHFKEEVREVRAGSDCGIGLAYQDVQKGDRIEAFEVEEVARSL